MTTDTDIDTSVPLHWQSARDIAAQARSGTLSPVEIARHFINRVEQVDPEINAFCHFDPEAVLAEAQQLENRGSAGKGRLYGVPFAIKDITQVAGVPAAAGLAQLQGFVPSESADLVTRLRGEGAIYLGKANQAEVGFCGVTDNAPFGPTRNPWNTDFISGGSSGGSAAAVAAGLCPIAEGGDGAGSVRIPAAVCGVVGMKPSLGQVPGHRPNQRFVGDWGAHGPITRNVLDAALMQKVMSGQSLQDPLSRSSVLELDAIADADLSDLRIAWHPDLGLGTTDPEIAEACAQAAYAFEELGCSVTEARPDWHGLAEAMWHGIWAPAYAGLSHLLDLKDASLHPKLVSLIEEGLAITMADYSAAQIARSKVWNAFQSSMGDYDLLISPTLSMQSFEVGKFCPDALADSSLRDQVLGWLLTYPFNLIGIPAISVPAGFTKQGLPMGLQIIGNMNEDTTIYQAAHALERLRPQPVQAGRNSA